ncbi:competence protein CoiA [Oceanobacillus massiliensis]|uniref:competence protein CoiA n=1 Tax=Oceanobacillus massiliensis TaxID=1465765 RepID=UPI000288664A|nr:competence protein CoiA family protein [Oceanobacillus massiliensis]
MLQAINKNGRVTTLAIMKREVIEKMKKEGEKFYCPVCKQPVIMKAGIKMIAHFAHQSISDCPSSEGGEGIYHEQGKLILYEWLKKHAMNVQLETYLPLIKQRPDILLSINDKKIAIEFQCARIPNEEIRKRNQGYKSAGIIPIWIVGANQFNRYNQNSLKMDLFTRQFLHQFSQDSPLAIYFFDPSTAHIAIVQDVFITNNTRAIGKIKIMPLKQLKFPDLFQFNLFSPIELMHLWSDEKRQFRLRTSQRLYGAEFSWRKWLYSKGYHPQNLPSAVHLPITSQHQMNTPLWNWQSKICLEIIHPHPIGGLISLEYIAHVLKTRTHSAASYPLIHSITHPIEQYFRTLENAGILQRVSSNSFQKLQQFSFYKHVEDAIKADNLLLQQLILQNSDKIRA